MSLSYRIYIVEYIACDKVFYLPVSFLINGARLTYKHIADNVIATRIVAIMIQPHCSYDDASAQSYSQAVRRWKLAADVCQQLAEQNGCHDE